MTIRLKQGDPVIGSLVGVEGDAVQVEVAGNRLNIKLDEVASMHFIEEKAAQEPEAQAADPARDAAQAAVAALKKLAGATEVGINFREYGTRLIDVKSAVDSATDTLPEGELKTAISQALAAYVDAGQAWNRTLGGGGRYTEASLYPDSDTLAAQLQMKYEVRVEVTEPMKGVPEHLLRTAPPGALTPRRYMRQSVILSTIWAAGRRHVEKADELLKKQ